MPKTTTRDLPYWVRVMAWLAAAYCIVLLTVFVRWEAGLVGCFIALCVSLGHD